MASIRNAGIKEYNAFLKDLINSLQISLEEKPGLFSCCSEGLNDNQRRKLTLFISGLKKLQYIPDEVKSNEFSLQSHVHQFKTQLQTIAFKTYMDIYIEERSINNSKIIKGKLLTKMEAIFQKITNQSSIDFLISSIESDKEPIDSKILSSAGSDKGFDTYEEKELIKHILLRVIQEGIFGANQQVFINCINVIVKMGFHAIYEWNAEIKKMELKQRELNLNELKLIHDKVKNEEQITKMFNELRKDIKLKDAILNLYQKLELKDEKENSQLEYSKVTSKIPHQ